MREQLLLLLRVSKPEYNKSLYEDYELYMNNQLAFSKTGLSKGQYDDKEGALAGEGVRLLYSVDGKKTWRELHGIQGLHKNNNAYIFCMYGVKYDPSNYDEPSNKYYHYIPWEYLRDFWQGDMPEMIIVKNTSVFIKSFENAAVSSFKNYAYGKVHYDLEKKLEDISYFDEAIRDNFESVFHKIKNPYEIQNEVRFSVIDTNKPDYIRLKLDKNNGLLFDKVPLVENKGVLIELSDLEFNEEHTLPIRFSSKISYYVPDN